MTRDELIDEAAKAVLEGRNEFSKKWDLPPLQWHQIDATTQELYRLFGRCVLNRMVKLKAMAAPAAAVPAPKPKEASDEQSERKAV